MDNSDDEKWEDFFGELKSLFFKFLMFFGDENNQSC